jgi:hypothetical protein
MAGAISADMAGRMLAAISMECEDEETSETQISREEQTQYLNRYVDRVTVKDRKDIGMILVLRGLEKELQWSNQGTVIVLDSLPADVIFQMYQMLKFKVEKK